MGWTVTVHNVSTLGGARRALKSTDKAKMAKYAKLANVAYHDQPIPRGFKVDERFLNDDVKTMYNDKTGELVFSIAGTQLDKPRSAMRDLSDDTKIFLGNASRIERISSIKNIIKLARGVYKDQKTNPVIVGHSLGATVGKKLSDQTGIDYIGFNRGGSPAQRVVDTVAAILDKPLHNTNQTDYAVRSDIISSPWLLGSDDVIEVPKTADSSHTLYNFMTGSGSGYRRSLIMSLPKNQKK